MQKRLHTKVLRLAIYATVCTVLTFGLIAVFAQLRFQPQQTYSAVFANVSGLRPGDFVRVAGVEVGKVKEITVQRDSTVIVEFGANDVVTLTEGTRATVRFKDLIGGRFLALEQGSGEVGRLDPGSTIPLSRTEPALDLEALVGGFRPLFRALDPDQVNRLTGQLIAAFQGQGVTMSSILAETASLTNTLADRDQLIGEVIGNLNTVLSSLGDHTDQFATAVDSVSELVAGLEDRKEDISSGIAYANAAAGSITDLLKQARSPIKTVVHEADRVAAAVGADREYVDNLLKTLPEAYQLLDRLALYGDFFSFYMCEVVLKVNGKGGQPVYVKLVDQKSGRCTPK
ncbi:MCE family protein [Mycolicibacterium elephantis]|uniref:MCE family protein n=1 Tax=Mycolicibacterium elephantis TaxID=81858 RepID=UPI0007E94AA7|nr:MCE family protein [Mycolicibacterium elephantis]OBB27376.1 mammalian cell entry protein [Mycolicibacterium elephantis]